MPARADPSLDRLVVRRVKGKGSLALALDEALGQETCRQCATATEQCVASEGLLSFADGGIDRAAGLRVRPERLTALAHSSNARHVVVWQGRPLVEPENRGQDNRSSTYRHFRLLEVVPDHPALGSEGPMFLGFQRARPIFCHNLQGGDLPPPPSTSDFLDPRLISRPDFPPPATFVDLRTHLQALRPEDAAVAATAKALGGWHQTHRFCARCGHPTDMIEAGWQRRCPACATVHFPRTDPVVIMLITRGNDVLLGRAPVWPERLYSLLAGFVEPGETIETAVRRETREETGVAVDAVSYLASQPWPFPASLMIGMRGEATTGNIVRDTNELDGAMWLSREEVARAFAGKHERVDMPRSGSIARLILWHWLADTLNLMNPAARSPEVAHEQANCG